MNAKAPFDPPYQAVNPAAAARPLRVLYVTAHVLGDAGANAAEIFPRLASASDQIAQTVVADFGDKKSQIKEEMGAEFLQLKSRRTSFAFNLFSAIRVARWSKRNEIPLIHIFYRQRLIPFIVFLGIFLRLFRAPAKILVDHRSVNLTRGYKAPLKKGMNLVMQCFVHHLAGNPWAVESNHPFVLKPKSLIDLGYDTLPNPPPAHRVPTNTVRLWFIGSLKPRNRKSEFLIDVFDHIQKRMRSTDTKIEIHVAGPARRDQISKLQENPAVLYHGSLPRPDLYSRLTQVPGIGVAFMNSEFHGLAPSLKFAEYAAMNFQVIASDTIGLRTQAQRMGLQGVTFVPEDVDLWAVALCSAAESWSGPAPAWGAKKDWSYDAIFNRQVVPLYAEITSR